MRTKALARAARGTGTAPGRFPFEPLKPQVKVPSWPRLKTVFWGPDAIFRRASGANTKRVVPDGKVLDPNLGFGRKTRLAVIGEIAREGWLVLLARKFLQPVKFV